MEMSITFPNCAGLPFRISVWMFCTTQDSTELQREIPRNTRYERKTIRMHLDKEYRNDLLPKSCTIA